MESEHSFFAEQTGLYSPRQHGVFIDAFYWNFNFIIVVLLSVLVFFFLHHRLRFHNSRKNVLNMATLAMLVTLMIGGLFLWSVDCRARRLWNERLFFLAQGYASAAEQMNLENLPVDSSAKTFYDYKKAFDIFKQWQSKDDMIVNVCVFHINDEGDFFYLLRPAADYNGDGVIAGELEEEAVPGQIYASAQSEPVLLDAVQTGKPQMTKSLYYAGGLPWLYAAVPIHQEKGKNDLLFVIDFHAKEWIRSIHEARRIPLYGTILSVLLVIGATMQILMTRRLLERESETLGIVTKNERKYNHIIDNSHDAVALIRDGFFTYSNRRMNLLFGCDQNGLIEKTPLDISPHFQPDGQLSAKLMRLHIENAENGYSEFFEWSFSKPDGTALTTEVFLDPITIDGEPLLILVAHDLSDLQRAIRAENETRIKSNFLANISHEIRTPLTAIIGYVDHVQHEQESLSKSILYNDSDNDVYAQALGQHSHCMQIIRSNAEFLLTILNDILDLSKIEAEKMDVENIDIAFQPFFQEIISLYSLKAKEKGLEFSVVNETPLPGIIKTDPIRLKQVLVNLIGNALKFTEKGSIKISVSWKTNKIPPQWNQISRAPHFTIPHSMEGVLVFSISDTGIGMSSEALDSACQPFHQADTAMTRRFGGTGLGLAISKRLVCLLKGSMEIQSAEGEGSTFVISLRQTLPKNSRWQNWNGSSSRQKQTLPQKSIVSAKTNLQGANILLVEDCADTQRLVSLILKKAGADVCIANNGSEAIEKVQEQQYMDFLFDIVLMDLQMPVLDGYEATTQIREWECLCDIPHTTIIALTANSSEENKKKAFDVGMDDFCCKPIDIPNLLQVIESWKSHKQRNAILNFS